MGKKYVVTLTPDERTHLDGLLRRGKAAALVLTRARILLKADEADDGPGWEDGEIAAALDVGERTVGRVRQRFVERGFEACLQRKPQDKPSRERTLDGAAEAQLIALACSPAPVGRAHWTMQLLADKLVELKVVDAVCDETVRRAMKKTRSSRG
jgi:transposase